MKPLIYLAVGVAIGWGVCHFSAKAACEKVVAEATGKASDVIGQAWSYLKGLV